MIEKLQDAIRVYVAAWQATAAATSKKDFFSNLQPTAVAWKTADLQDFDRCMLELRTHADHIHLAWVNERWLATIHLKANELAENIRIVKLMQRRPGSSDAVGLDHLDFYSELSKDELKNALAAESSLTWTEEHNGDHCKWLSVWFNNTEAKLRTDTVVDICIEELHDVRQQLLAKE
jgi:hypothetical protein